MAAHSPGVNFTNPTRNLNTGVNTTAGATGGSVLLNCKKKGIRSKKNVMSRREQ